MIEKAFADIGPADVQVLIDDQVRESRTLDYKQALPAEKVPFLKDVSALANTDGGDILFGVSEKREGGKTTGLPDAVVGLPGFVLDQEGRRLDDIIRSGLKPRLTGVRYKQLDCPGGAVMLMRIEPGFAGPYMVAHDENRFWGRGGMSNFVLDADELRRLFLRTSGLPERVRRLRSERLEQVTAGDTPFPLLNNPKVVMHVVPLRSFDSSVAVDVQKAGNELALLPPIGASGWDGRFNLDGYATFRGTPEGSTRAYTQLYRNGFVEAVDAGVMESDPRAGKTLDANYLIGMLIPALKSYLGLFGALDCPPPYSVLLSLIGVKGYYIPGGYGDTSRKVDRDRLLLPDVFLPELPLSLTDVLRPTFDALWQASGWSCWQEYNQAKQRFG
jgi:hypothetical protein